MNSRIIVTLFCARIPAKVLQWSKNSHNLGFCISHMQSCCRCSVSLESVDTAYENVLDSAVSDAISA